MMIMDSVVLLLLLLSSWSFSTMITVIISNWLGTRQSENCPMSLVVNRASPRVLASFIICSTITRFWSGGKSSSVRCCATNSLHASCCLCATKIYFKPEPHK